MPVLLLIVAVIVGGVLRFERQAYREMSADEGATWAAAAAPTLREVLSQQAKLNPGKLATHELLLHGWILAFGDSETALRSLSAGLGTLAIAMVYLVSVELMRIEARAPSLDRTSDRAPDRTPAGTGQGLLAVTDERSVASVCALLFALSVVTIKYSREARMYPLLLALLLTQIVCLLRAVRLHSFVDLVALAAFTALAVSTHFTAVLVVLAEGIWLLSRVLTQRGLAESYATSTIWRPAAAIGCGLAVLAPFLRASLQASAQAVRTGALVWVPPPTPWQTVSLFNKAIGSFAFPVVVALAVFGAICGRRKFWGAIYYALLWMWLPVLALLVISYLITPLLVERYALSCFVAFFFLAALGTCLLSTARLRLGALAVVVILTLSHVYAYSRKPHDAQWREATATALRSLTSEGKVAVAPDYAISVVMYYLPVDKRSVAVPWSQAANSPAKVLIFGDQGTDQDAERFRADYPRLVGAFRGVQVRSR